MHIKHICYGAGDDVMSSLPNLKTYYLFEMNRKIIYSILFALIAMAGKGQIKCHVVGTVDDGVERQTFYISQLGTTENDDAKWTVVNVEDGHFSLDIAADTTEILWGSWCGPCRAHAKALIPIYEKYRDAGLTVVAIAREWNMDSFRRAMEHDQYPWPSLVDYQDRYGVWEKHGIKNGSGKILLIDSDGTILSTTNDALELEPIIKKALNID